jgi:hypothetical protein
MLDNKKSQIAETERKSTSLGQGSNIGIHQRSSNRNIRITSERAITKAELDIRKIYLSFCRNCLRYIPENK